MHAACALLFASQLWCMHFWYFRNFWPLHELGYQKQHTQLSQQYTIVMNMQSTYIYLHVAHPFQTALATILLWLHVEGA